MQPAANQHGTTTVTLTVSDGNSSAQDTFVLTVVAVNDAPVISDIADQSTDEDAPKAVNYLIADVDTTLHCSTSISVTSSNTTLLPVVNVAKSGTFP